MNKNLTRHGNSLALVIEKPILQLLRIDAKTRLSVTTDGQCLIVTPVRRGNRRRRFEAALEDGNRRYARALKRLAE